MFYFLFIFYILKDTYNNILYQNKTYKYNIIVLLNNHINNHKSLTVIFL